MKKNIRKLVLALLTAALLVSLAGVAFAADTGLLQSFAKNARGETYGNNLQAQVLGYEADLIAARGEDGVEGYVRWSDLYDDGGVSSPKEAAVYMANYESLFPRYIPLYLEDGVTVIGRFKIG